MVYSALITIALATPFTNRIMGRISFVVIIRATYSSSIFKRDLYIYNLIIHNTGQSATVTKHSVQILEQFESWVFPYPYIPTRSELG